MAYSYKQYDLTNESIDEISYAVQVYMEKLKIDRLTFQRIRLTVEELLLHIREVKGEDTKVFVSVSKRFGQHVFRMYYRGESFNPINNDTGDGWNETIMASLGLTPAWNYMGGINTISLALAEKTSRGTVGNIILAAAMAVLLGFLGRFIPLQSRQEVINVLLTPFTDSFFGLISTFSGFMIALTICSGVLEIGDSAMLGKMGKKVILHYVRTLFLICAICLACYLPLFHISFSHMLSHETANWGAVSQMVFDMLPSNPIEPFANGNSIQIIVIAMFVGIGLLAIGERGRRLRAFVDEGTALTQHITTYICRFVPLSVFVMLLSQLWSGQTGQLLASWKPLTLSVGGIFVLVVVMLMLSSLRLHCSPILLLKKVLPPGIIGFSTASSMAAMTMGMNTCEKKLGVDKSLINFAYPLGTVVYMPGAIICFSAIVCSMVDIYRVEIDVSWVLIAIVTITCIAIAVPPIPGAGVMAYAILFAKLGIPREALLVATALEILVDFPTTGSDVFLICLKITEEAQSQKLLNREVLTSKENVE